MMLSLAATHTNAGKALFSWFLLWFVRKSLVRKHHLFCFWGQISSLFYANYSCIDCIVLMMVLSVQQVLMLNTPPPQTDWLYTAQAPPQASLVWHLNQPPLTRQRRQLPHKHNNILCVYPKFAPLIFVTTEEHVTRRRCLPKLCLPVTARSILLELFARKVGFSVTAFLVYITQTHTHTAYALTKPKESATLWPPHWFCWEPASKLYWVMYAEPLGLIGFSVREYRVSCVRNSEWCE